MGYVQLQVVSAEQEMVLKDFDIGQVRVVDEDEESGSVGSGTL